MRTASAVTLLAISSVLAADATLPAQLPSRHAVVATELPGSPRTVLLLVDLLTGGLTPVGRFAHDGFPPLAIAVDPVNRDAILALDLGGSSRLLRLGFVGTAVVSTRLLADVPGTATDLIVPLPGDVHVALGGSQGALLRVPRNGGASVSLLGVPRAAGLSSFGLFSPEVWIAQSGTLGQPVQLQLFEVFSGQSIWTVPLPGMQAAQITGLGEILASISTHVIADDQGRVWQSVAQQSLIQLPLLPALAPGSTNAVRVEFGSTGYLLGGAADPFLRAFDAWVQTPQNWSAVAGPLPGDPVDLALTERSGAAVHIFANACAPAGPDPTINVGGGLPRLGNANFQLLSRSSPATLAFLAFGGSDQQHLGIALPLPLPAGGCLLIAAPQAVGSAMTDPTAYARLALPIPNLPALAGTVWFGQWIHLVAGGSALATSPGIALHLDP